MKFREQYKSILETIEPQKYGVITTKHRQFFPRGLQISPEFQKAFQKEFARVKQTYNLNKQEALKKINKALLWLAN